jgi:hypothetical protein
MDRIMLRSAKEIDARPVGWKEMLPDGTQVFMGPISAGERELERSFIENTSPGARHLRFLDTMKSPSPVLHRA